MTASHTVDSPRRAARLAADVEAKARSTRSSRSESASNSGFREAVETESDLRQLLRALGTGVAGALFAMVLAIAALVIVVPMAIGGQALTVLTNSMAPGMPSGTLAIVKPTPIDDIKVGDVMTYQIRSGDPAVVSHRVVSRSISTNGDTTFITRGDNNDMDDANPVTDVQIRGTVWYSIPLLGWVNSALTGGMRTWIVPVVVAICFGYGAWAFTSGFRERRRAARETARSGKTRGRRSSALATEALRGAADTDGDRR